ncbi:MAG: T9SS type A sorting domain-containing protein [Bacteroidetes bacterium]|nr:T9SS type A sorting domain-containing protein [Bacteroidota bacterium]
MKTRKLAVVVGSATRSWIRATILMPFIWTFGVQSATVYTSTGGTSGTPKYWSNSGTWSATGTGAPRVYLIRSGDHVFFDTSNNSPYIDTVLVMGDLYMNNNVSMTFTSSGAIGLIGTNSTISGGSNNSLFVWNGTSAFITGPFTAANIISNGPRYATASSALASGGNAQAAFVMGTLPVDITEFYTSCSDNTIQVHWNTINENELAYFDVLQSKDGKDWKSVAKMDALASASGASNYTADIKLEANIQNAKDLEKNKYYFKLKMVDVNGNYRFSESIVANCKFIQANNWAIDVSPNPAEETPVLSLTALNPGEINVEIYTGDGKLLRNMSVTGDFKNQIHSYTLKDLDPGIYRIRAMSNNTVQSYSFVKL